MLLKLIGIQDLQEKRKILQCYQVDRWMSNIIAEIAPFANLAIAHT